MLLAGVVGTKTLPDFNKGTLGAWEGMGMGNKDQDNGEDDNKAAANVQAKFCSTGEFRDNHTLVPIVWPLCKQPYLHL